MSSNHSESERNAPLHDFDESLDWAKFQTETESEFGVDIQTSPYTKTTVETDPFTKSQLYHDWYHRVASGPPNDYIIVVTADPRFTGVSGTGKTTISGGLAKWYLDFSQGGFDARTQYTMNPDDILNKMYPETGPGSCLIYDEAQGTPSSTGLNKMRSTKTEALDAINTIATRRKDRKTLIIVSQSLKSLNKDLFDFIDAWLLIRDDINYVATHYQVQPDVFDLESHNTKTPGVEELTWDPLPDDDDDYAYMENVKDAASTKRDPVADDEDEDEGGKTVKEIAMEIAEGKLDDYVSEHSQNKTPYINHKLIRTDYEMSLNESKEVKELLQRQFSNKELKDHV